MGDDCRMMESGWQMVDDTWNGSEMMMSGMTAAIILLECSTVPLSDAVSSIGLGSGSGHGSPSFL